MLVDAPCSGSGTWRRNPEGRWRLTPERCSTGSSLNSSACSTLAPSWSGPAGGWSMPSARSCPAKGQAKSRDFLADRSSWIMEETPMSAGRLDGAGRLLTPGHDGTDGFFVARLGRPC